MDHTYKYTDTEQKHNHTTKTILNCSTTKKKTPTFPSTPFNKKTKKINKQPKKEILLTTPPTKHNKKQKTTNHTKNNHKNKQKNNQQKQQLHQQQ